MSRSRGIVAILALAVAPGCLARDDPGEIPAPTPGLELAGVDDPAARGRFQTRLIRPGPASRIVEEARKPADAIEAPYRSGALTLRAFASPPAEDGRRRPAVLFLHGGFAFGAAHWEATRPFREAGFVAMVPTLRGENGQDGDCSLFFDEVEDVLAASEALAARPDVDPGRLYLAGHSVGGTIALLTALTSSRFRAVASFSGSPDQVEYTRGRPELIPFDPDRPGEFRARSPVVFADRFRCPVRMYRGEEEYWLQGPTRRTAILTRRAGLDVDEVEVPGGHDTANPDVIRACLAFFRSR